MNAILQLLALIPTTAQIMIASVLIGGAGVYAHESRYMTVGDFTKSYILELKSEIRQIKKDLGRENINQEVKEMLREQLDTLIADLCYEAPDDPYCKEE